MGMQIQFRLTFISAVAGLQSERETRLPAWNANARVHSGRALLLFVNPPTHSSSIFLIFISLTTLHCLIKLAILIEFGFYFRATLGILPSIRYPYN